MGGDPAGANASAPDLIVCVDGRTAVKCTDYGDWTQAWTEVKG